LRRRGVDRVIIGGLALDYCVKETALDALDAGFDVLVLEDATRAVEVAPGDAAKAKAALRAAGAQFLTIDDYVSA
jgi:nicotinamidase/pyrazinamidase